MKNRRISWSGITPGHPSFDDKGIPPPPLKWKGKCEVSGCNNKLIGIRNFVSGDSAIDIPMGLQVEWRRLQHFGQYKVGATFGCLDSDILAGYGHSYRSGVMLFHFSRGNSGPHNKSLSNEAPWILTVGASKTDRRIRTTVTLGNKKILNGEALYQPKTYKPKVRPLVYRWHQDMTTTGVYRTCVTGPPFQPVITLGGDGSKPALNRTR
ncbi:peptidase S8/S53 domain-containing protein [Tanacetum coccineum]